MNDNPCYKSCVNRSPTREQCVTMQSVSGVDTSAFQIDEELNDVYEKRLAEINEHANGDANLKEITYKEWIEMLRQINKTLITNFQDMERETTERLALLQHKVSANCRHTQDSELLKCRKDMTGLIQLVRNGRQSGDWRVEKYNFETITAQDIFGNEASCCEHISIYDKEFSKQPNSSDPKFCPEEKTKLFANVKALAFEVAAKHDEIRELKKQILSMEDEIQKAQKKIQLKDDVIRELRSDLKSLPKCSAVVTARMADRTTPTPCCSPTLESKPSESCVMDAPTTPRPSLSARDSINSLNCQYENFIGYHYSLEEEGKFIKCLKDEINELFEIQHSSVEDHRRTTRDQQEQLIDKVDKLIKNSNALLQNKLMFYRNELITLQIPQAEDTMPFYSDGDSGISSDTDADVKIVNSVRTRFGILFKENQRLKKEEKSLLTKFEDVNSKVIVKTELVEKTSKALKEVAEALSKAISMPIDYDITIEERQDMTNNPIVEAVNQLSEALKEKDEIIKQLRHQTESSEKAYQQLKRNIQTLQTEPCDLKKTV